MYDEDGIVVDYKPRNMQERVVGDTLQSIVDFVFNRFRVGQNPDY